MFQKLSDVKTPRDLVNKEPHCVKYTGQVTGEYNEQCLFSQMKQAAAHLCCSQTLLIDPLPSPCAICIIPKDNTAAARVTKH